MNSNTKGQLCCLIAALVMAVLGVDWFLHVHNSLNPNFNGSPNGERRDRGDRRRRGGFQEKVGGENDGLPWGAHPGDGSLMWLDTSGWIDKKWGNASGVKTAMAPKILKLGWNENSIARQHDLYEAYSSTPFQPGKENFVRIASTLRGDQLPATFGTRQYDQLGYYRFKVVPLFFEGRVRGPASPVLELVLVKKKPLAQLRSSWVNSPCWNPGPRKNAAGPIVASAPQRLWLDWLDLEDAVVYRVYSSYSATPFQAGKENYLLLLTTKMSAYHSGDPRYLTGAPRSFTKPGYYRFKVVAVSATGTESKFSEVRQLVLK